MHYSLSVDWCKQAQMPLILVLLLFVSAGCGHNEPIKIGFAGELTGMNGGLGVAARDGAQLATAAWRPGGS